VYDFLAVTVVVGMLVGWGRPNLATIKASGNSWVYSSFGNTLEVFGMYSILSFLHLLGVTGSNDIYYI